MCVVRQKAVVHARANPCSIVSARAICTSHKDSRATEKTTRIPECYNNLYGHQLCILCILFIGIDVKILDIIKPNQHKCEYASAT